MSTATHFYNLSVVRISPEAGSSAAITLGIPPELRDTFEFTPGQFLTLRATIAGEDVRRSYSICSPRSALSNHGELTVGIKCVVGGVFSNWAIQELKVGDVIQVMPPQGRFVPKADQAAHRVGFAAGSGITPILSIMASSLEEDPESRFTLVYGNRRADSIMFHETLQNLKDRYPSRVNLIHVLSRQAQEVPLLQGHIDANKVSQLCQTLLPLQGVDEAFICGPEPMIDSTEAALLAGGLSPHQIHTERFTPAARSDHASRTDSPQSVDGESEGVGAVELTVVFDGKPHHLRMHAHQKVLDVALQAGLDLPWSCKGGVCCTCRAKVLEGEVQMEKNYTLEPWETSQGFVLSCQAHPVTEQVVISYDER